MVTSVRQRSGVRLITSGSDKSMPHSVGNRSQELLQAGVGSAASGEVRRGRALGRLGSAWPLADVISGPWLNSMVSTVRRIEVVQPIRSLRDRAMTHLHDAALDLHSNRGQSL